MLNYIASKFLILLIAASAVVIATSQDYEGVVFKLYTRKNVDTEQILLLNDDDGLKSSHYDGTKPTVFSVHGWLSSSLAPWQHQQKKLHLEIGAQNIIIVDHTVYSDDRDWPRAKSNAPKVGHAIADFIRFLERAAATSRKNMSLIGHSLGGHVLGYVGEYIEKENKVARMIGLDSIDEDTYMDDTAHTLDPSDADFVQEIHTVYRVAKAHADFYPIGQGTLDGRQWHGVSRDFFTESMTNACPFTAVRCPSKEDFEAGKCTCESHGCNRMGYFATKPVQERTRFFLLTNDTAPHCRG